MISAVIQRMRADAALRAGERLVITRPAPIGVFNISYAAAHAAKKYIRNASIIRQPRLTVFAGRQGNFKRKLKRDNFDDCLNHP